MEGEVLHLHLDGALAAIVGQGYVPHHLAPGGAIGAILPAGTQSLPIGSGPQRVRDDLGDELRARGFEPDDGVDFLGQYRVLWSDIAQVGSSRGSMITII